MGFGPAVAFLWSGLELQNRTGGAVLTAALGLSHGGEAAPGGADEEAVNPNPRAAEAERIVSGTRKSESETRT